MSEKRKLLRELLSLKLQSSSGRLSKSHLIGQIRKKLTLLNLGVKK